MLPERGWSFHFRMIRTVVIDDEESARQNLCQMLRKFCPEVEVLGTAGSVKTGVKVILDQKPDLVLLDINLSDGSGFDLLEIFSRPDFDVVFVSAYDQYAIRAIRFSALDYLLKPVGHKDLQDTIKRVLTLSDKARRRANIGLLKANHQIHQSEPQKIAIPVVDGIELIHVTEILYVEADNNYSTIYLKDGGKFIASRPIKKFELLLAPHAFLRVYKSHLVNLNCIKRFLKGRGGHLEMLNGALVPVSRSRKAEVLAWLDPI